MSGVITLTSDFGLRDPFVGVMKGRILSRFPGAQIVDLTHDILAHWPAEAGFWLARAFQYFPEGSVHVAVVDPGVGTARKIALVEADGHRFLAPDNGLLAPVVSRSRDAKVWHLRTERLSALGLSRVSATFHGRDIFAPLAAEVAAGRLGLSDLGQPCEELVPAWVDDPVGSPGRLQGSIITVDHFGNLLSNIDAQRLDGWLEPLVRVGHQKLPLRRTYGEVKPGEALALINSFGVIEIAVAEGRAVDVLGVSRGAPVTVLEAVRRS
jgi:S-adenosylmethionine hydrolase